MAAISPGQLTCSGLRLQSGTKCVEIRLGSAYRQRFSSALLLAACSRFRGAGVYRRRRLCSCGEAVGGHSASVAARRSALDPARRAGCHSGFPGGFGLGHLRLLLSWGRRGFFARQQVVAWRLHLIPKIRPHKGHRWLSHSRFESESSAGLAVTG